VTDSPIEKAAAAVVAASQTIADCELGVTECAREAAKAAGALEVAQQRLALAREHLANTRVMLDEELDS
jgi:anti-sigma regulatory factor (Ser/Thr protein kinase)